MKLVKFIKSCPVAADGVSVVSYEAGQVASLPDGIADDLIKSKHAKAHSAKAQTPESGAIDSGSNEIVTPESPDGGK